ncbi:MAG: SUMF1/EgtB/PvdO family nonheme iron enzyme [Chthonomonadetes bacterium]|nr:SUMF1/EgtB/PvdO family nonheme iron enzyme [Chthonomonadetes bacterium]
MADNEWIVIPAGEFVMGTSPEEASRLAKQYGHHPSWLSGEQPRRVVYVPAFAIQKYPVTNREYAEFCKSTGHTPPLHWRGNAPPADLLDHPVTFVSQEDAEAYARWLGARLPTEAEWEKAARGTDGRLYPWGNRFDSDACCWNRQPRDGMSNTAPVGSFPRGISPYGVMDMVGNVAEWCADRLSPAVGVLKGGCWLTKSPLNLRVASRTMSSWRTNRSDMYGFRCAKEVR